MRISFVSLFPAFFDGPMSQSIPARAQRAGLLSWESVDPRDFASGRHRAVDDTPYGGGAGMVLRPDVMGEAVEWTRSRNPGAPVILMSPQGQRFCQADARRLAQMPGMILVCGRYEGVDERFVERHVDAELSLGDFVLSGGEPAAFTVADAVIRLLPGALGNAGSSVEESFTEPRLEHPQFTRPAHYAGLDVPAVLSGGDHAKIARWRQGLSLWRTAERRPDLLSAAELEAAAAIAAGEEGWLARLRPVAGLHSTVDLPVDSGTVRAPDDSRVSSPKRSS